VSLGPAPLVGDARRLRQLTTTLVANALAYTPPGGTIHVSTWAEGPQVLLEVSDTGPGIDPDELHRVFDRFYRGRRTAGSSGSGIGLAIARELAAAHGGSVSASNAPAGGAAFTVKLPTAPTPFPQRTD
jgi:signal transduction histidine kinase